MVLIIHIGKYCRKTPQTTVDKSFTNKSGKIPGVALLVVITIPFNKNGSTFV